VNVIRLASACAAVAALGTAGSALACGDGGSMNEVATPAVKSALVDAFVTAHPRLHLRAADVDRLAGHTYYGTMGDSSAYAVATFVVGGKAWKPTILARFGTGRWHVVRQTHGGICGRYVPEPLIALWYLQRWHGSDCFVEPA
jgi:hypothetical protein